MRIQPREQLLTLWRSVVEVSLQDDKWKWGGRYERNSISDAEQLLTIMYPATELANFRLDVPDRTEPDVLVALKGLGDELDIPERHIEYYTDRDGPIFPGGSYFKSTDPTREPSPEQLKLDVVDSFSMSVTLMLSTLAFIRGFNNAVEKADLVERLGHLESIASKRLTAALVGLLRSFVINVFTPDSVEGRTLLRSVNQSDLSARRIADDLRASLQEIRASLGDVTIGFGGVPPELENRNRLFEIGWTWGIADDAPEVENAPSAGTQREGFAESAPFLYFTVNALDGIADLFSGRTTVLGLLNEEQQRLAAALRLRWELTQRYWSTIATFGDGRTWPLQDLPWRTTDGSESEHFSLLITSLVIQDMEIRKTANVDHRRLGGILNELGQRGRVTRRAVIGDEALKLHVPGTEVQLGGSGGADGTPSLYWQLNDYAPLLLKNTLRLATLAQDSDFREDLVQAADQLWDHVALRRIENSIVSGLWDDPARVFEDIKKHSDLPSWYYTERVMECVVITMRLMTAPTPPSAQLLSYARDILSEADKLFDSELLNTSVEARGSLSAELEDARFRLNHARTIIAGQPATAVALAMDILRMLERYRVARLNADEGAG
jgi:hypothetical protein